MLGIEAINANNGWAMALTGALIVMFGLAILSFLISQLHKIIAIFEKKESSHESAPVENQQPTEQPSSNIFGDLQAIARIYKSMSTDLGEKFELVELYQSISQEALPHPHLTIRSLRHSGYLIPCGDGTYCWKSE